MMSNFWCPLPWSHVGVKNNGTLRMCSHSQSVGVGNTVLHNNGQSLTIEDMENTDILNCDTLKDVRRQFLSGEFPSQCKRCLVEKNAGHRSRDEWETLRHQDILTKQDALSNTMADGTLVNGKILSLDLRVGHQCNLRCSMCFPGESSRWYKDYELITGYKTFWVDGREYDLDIKNADFDWVRSEEKVNALVNAGRYITKINFGGGEPLMIKHCHSLVKKLVDAGYAKNIELEYSTNLTTFPDEMWEVWSKFKEVKFCCSIDAYGEANEAIRYPSNWNTVESNLNMLDNTPDNISAFTSTTISTLSLEHWADFMLWVDSKKYKKINSTSHNFCASHPVYNPKSLSVTILEKADFDNIIKIQKDKINSSTSNIKEIMLDKINFYEKFYNHIENANIDQFRKDFVNSFTNFEKQQNQDWSNIFPLANNIVNRWRNLYEL